MNYSLLDLPDSGKNPTVYMDISLQGEVLGRLQIRLFRDVFPAGVENFVKIAASRTYQVTIKGDGRYKYKKEVKRTFDGCKFYHFLYNNYIVAGDIYNNDGSNAGSIYNDNPIPPDFGDYYYPHETKGLVSLIPFKDEETGRIFYDSTFMITLDDSKPSNILGDLDSDQIVIGQVYGGMDVLDKMNSMIKPYARRKYPNFIISKSDVYAKKNGCTQRLRPLSLADRVKFTNEPMPAADEYVAVEDCAVADDYVLV